MFIVGFLKPPVVHVPGSSGKTYITLFSSILNEVWHFTGIFCFNKRYFHAKNYKSNFKNFKYFYFIMIIMEDKIRMYIVISKKENINAGFELNLLHNRDPFGHRESVLNLPSPTEL